LFLLFFAQDIAHIDGGYPPSNFQCPELLSIGRFSGDHKWPVLGDRRGRVFIANRASQGVESTKLETKEVTRKGTGQKKPDLQTPCKSNGWNDLIWLLS
jgi:hypothetical protein